MSTLLRDGFYDVPKGMVATVVTHLEMTERAAARQVPELDVRFAPLDPLTPELYRDLFRRVGGQDWLWFSRLQLGDDALSAIISDPEVQIFTLLKDDAPSALLELDFRESGACELAFFGVAPVLIGTPAGRMLMNHAIDLAWSQPITRFHVHTCTLDHPAALFFYRRSGFTPVRQQIEIMPDPRLSGVLPLDAGPHVPIFPA